MSTSYTTDSTIKALLAKAHSAMLGVASKSGDGLDDELKEMLGNAATAAAAAPQPVEEKKSSDDEEDEEEEEDVSEEDTAAGLGALFG